MAASASTTESGHVKYMHESLSNPGTSPFVRYLRESGEVEIIPCSVANAVHLETLRLRVNAWLGKADQLGVGFFSRIVSDVSTYFGLAVIDRRRRKLVLGIQFTDGASSDKQAPKNIDWKRRLRNARKEITTLYGLSPLLHKYPIPYPAHRANGYSGWNRRRLRMLVENERRLCWNLRTSDASEQLDFTPLVEDENSVYERLSELSVDDIKLLYASAEGGGLFTVLAAHIGISSGAWVLACDLSKEFASLDMELYMIAIEPLLNSETADVTAAKRVLSELDFNRL